MSRTESTMLPLGTPAPVFQLPDVVSGSTVGLEQASGRKALLIMFICRHCPYVRHVQGELAKLGREYVEKSLGIVAISSNDAGAYPDDSPENLKKMALELGFPFPFCYDESQDVARAFTAACTPDFFLFDGDLRLVYRGRLDASNPRNGIPITGEDLRAAIDALLDDRPVNKDQRPSLGCNIKWRNV